VIIARTSPANFTSFTRRFPFASPANFTSLRKIPFFFLSLFYDTQILELLDRPSIILANDHAFTRHIILLDFDRFGARARRSRSAGSASLNPHEWSNDRNDTRRGIRISLVLRLLRHASGRSYRRELSSRCQSCNLIHTECCVKGEKHDSIWTSLFTHSCTSDRVTFPDIRATDSPLRRIRIVWSSCWVLSTFRERTRTVVRRNVRRRRDTKRKSKHNPIRYTPQRTPTVTRRATDHRLITWAVAVTTL